MPLTNILRDTLLAPFSTLVSTIYSFFSLSQQIHILVQNQIFINCGHKSICNVR